MYSSLPEWFVLTPGFRWFDSDGELCVLLGWEPECETRTAPGVDLTRGQDTIFPLSTPPEIIAGFMVSRFSPLP